MPSNALLAIFLLAFLSSCNRKATTSPPLSNQQMRQDVAYLDRKLNQMYPGLGYYSSEKAYQNYRDSVVAELPDTLEYRDFFQRIAPLINSQKDGHLNLYPRKRNTDKTTPYLPLTIREAAGKYYIAFNASADSTLRRGTELLAIEDRPMAELHAFLADKFRAGADADILTGRMYRTLIAFPGRYGAWFGTKDSLLVTYVQVDTASVATGDTLQRYLITLPNKASGTYLEKRYGKEIRGTKNLALSKIDSTIDGVVLTVNSFSKFKKRDPFDLKFKHTLRRDFKEIKKKNYQNLVVDLRNNGGGSVNNSAYLLTYLLREPFSVFGKSTLKPGAVWPYVMSPPNPISPIFFFLSHRRDRATGLWRSKTSKKKGFKPNKKYGYQGNLYFLANGASFSATVSVLAHAKSQGVGTLVGETPGGAYWGDFAARFKIVTLPNSKIRVRIPLKTLYHDIKPSEETEIRPTFPISRTYLDLVTPGRDYGLEYVKKLIHTEKKS